MWGGGGPKGKIILFLFLVCRVVNECTLSALADSQGKHTNNLSPASLSTSQRFFRILRKISRKRVFVLLLTPSAGNLYCKVMLRRSIIKVWRYKKLKTHLQSVC